MRKLDEALFRARLSAVPLAVGVAPQLAPPQERSPARTAVIGITTIGVTGSAGIALVVDDLTPCLIGTAVEA